MSSARGLRRRFCGAVVAVGVATLAVAAVAPASNAVKGGSYVGSYSDGAQNAISFKVSANGKKVVELTLETPIKCKGGCGGVATASGGSASISKQGRFKVKLNLVFPPGSHKSEGTETVTGKFLKHGVAKGIVSSHFNGGDSSDRTVKWTATS
jgi:hypothetical protein